MAGRRLVILLLAVIAISILLHIFVFNHYQKITGLSSHKRQPGCSKELKQLFNADVHDRQDWKKLSRKELKQLSARDLSRRIRVAELFAEGCFKTAEDYAEASLIYQHGDVPDHYYQAFIWANKAVALGDETQKHMVALTIDRYLVSIGKKQLFGSQAFASPVTDWCYCLQQVEASFPRSMRQDYMGESLEEQYAWVDSMNHGKKHCKLRECKQSLKPSPKGAVPGFW